MLCPNCKTELVQINGRYICSGCGKEVPESEVNVGDWGEGSFDGDTVIPAPGSLSVAAEAKSLSVPDDYIEGEEEVAAPQRETDEAQPVPTASGAETQQIPVSPVAATKEVGFYDLKPNPKPVDLDSLQKNLAGIGSVKMTQNMPKSQSSPQQIPVPVPDQKEEAKPAPQGEGSSLFSGVNPPLPNDPEIYKDPLFDQNISEEPKEQKRKSTSKSSVNNKTMIILIATGGFLAILLLVGGIYAYRALTKSSEIDDANLGAAAEVIDCDTSGDATKVAGCIAENFSACKVASWTAPYAVSPTVTASMSYQISGPVDNTCQVEALVSKSESDASLVGETMSCLLDNTLDVDQALTSLSGTTCTGDLADVLFPSADTTDSTEDDVDFSEEASPEQPVEDAATEDTSISE